MGIFKRWLGKENGTTNHADPHVVDRMRQKREIERRLALLQTELDVIRRAR